jgi:DNA-binding MarR family transcriptional regulator
VASRQLSALIDAGYVVREPSAEDRRAWLVRTTEDGQRVLGESHRRMVHGFSEALGDWSAADLAAVSEGLTRLAADFADASAQTEIQETRR